VYVVASAVTVVIAHSMGVSPGWALVVGLVAPGVVVIAFRFVFAAIDGARSGGVAGDNLSGVDLMSGWQFEDYVAQVVRSCGLPVIMTAGRGDWGVDLVVGKRPDRVAIQCKRHSRQIGPGAVQQVVAGAPMQGCTKTMVVSNQEFTPAAQQLAELHDCTLVGRSDLPLLGATIRRIVGQSEVA
jgi:restriction system protein